MKITDKLGKEWIFFDGGSGTLLQKAGLAPGELPETWNLTHPQQIEELYSGYLNAGCDFFNTNTFGANRLKYPDNIEQIVSEAVRLARLAREKTGRTDACIALDLGPTGKLLEPMGDLSFEDAVSLYAEVVRSGAQAGADLVLIETMSDSYETKAAVLAAKENCDLPVFVTMTFDASGKTLTGGTPESMTAMLEGLGVDALGINCSLGPREMIPTVKRFLDAASVPVVVNPNAGLPRIEDGVTVYDIGPEEFAAQMAEIAALGVQGVGGCCGTTPEHIRRLIETVRPMPFVPETAKNHTVICSFSQTVEIGDRPIIIGERINPTGKKKLKAALVSGDMDYVLGEGLKQEAQGADVLDVNTGLPGIDEAAVLSGAVKGLQGILSLPLQIDTADPAAMEAAMRLYNGKPMVNSVNGKQEVMDKVFPLIRKYGGVVVALLLDEDGIPQTVEGRLAIARRILAEADRYGIQPKDIVFDALALTISAEPEAALTALGTIAKIRTELGGHSILGVSNISFGLPRREIVNSHFLSMALYAGLSCAILNPGSEEMRESIRAYLALSGKDPQCGEYISVYAGTKAPSAQAAASGSTVKSGTAGTDARSTAKSAATDAEMTIGACIERGLVQRAGLQTEKQIAGGWDAMEIVNQEVIPALDRVGKDFEKNVIFLPQLIQSAEAAKAAFAAVKQSMQGTTREIKGKVILATVKGDIHDIGKNIVKVLMENYGYEVIDLGRDVDPQMIVDTARSEQVRLVGLSALMTTTVPSMEETIRLLHQELPGVLTMVGGAVMNEETAARIGADYYGKDAMASVRICDQVFSGN